MDGMIYASEEEAKAAELAKHEAEETKRKNDLVSLARQRFAAAEEAESEIRRLAEDDIRFRAGQQWDPSVLAARKMDKRPALVINRIPQFERQVTNEQRAAKPSIQVSPVDSGGDRETADIFQGLIRHIEYDSGADVAYDTALTCAVRGGFGYYRVVSEYESESSFDQVLKVKRVRDPFSVYLDPSHQEQDASDAEYGFVVGDGVSAERFKTEYPDCNPVAGGWGNRANSSGHMCQVVEYFYKERIPDELVMFRDGEGTFTVFKSELEKMPVESFAGSVRVSTRPSQRVVVRWAKIAGSTVVEESEFPSKWIPIFPVLGDELWVDNKRVLEGIVRHVKDPQRMYNYWSTSVTETIALAPRAPYIVEEGQIAGYEKDWAKASSHNVPFLKYRGKNVGGTMAPPPQRNAFEAPIGAMSTAMQFAADDMKSTTGIYDSALGNRSNESSGRAIRARQEQSQVSTLHFSDNLARSLRHLGRVLIDAIPRVYAEHRVLRILGDDQSEKLVSVNGPPVKGQERMFQLDAGRYDVTVTMGPSFTSKRQEAVQAMMELSRSHPQMAQALGDLMVANMDWPGAAKMAERLKKLLPPGLAEPDEKSKVDPAALAHQLAQSQQMIQQMTQQLNTLGGELETQAFQLQSKERVELLNKMVDLAKAFAACDPTDGEGREILAGEMLHLKKRLQTFFAPAPEAPEQEHQDQAQLPPGGMQ